LPKVVQEIEIGSDQNFCHVSAKESDGKTYYKMKVPVSGTETHFDVSANLYTVQNKTLRQSETSFKGDFKMVKHMDRLFKSGGTPQEQYLEIFDTPSGRVLRELDIDPNPFQFRYCSSMSSCFDLPKKNFKSTIELK
jgi:hypothetical protein